MSFAEERQNCLDHKAKFLHTAPLLIVHVAVKTNVVARTSLLICFAIYKNP